jgi:translation elongation factor EF-G
MKYKHWSIGAIITNPTRTLFYIQQKDEGYYVPEYRLKHCFFGGGKKKNETEIETLKRELSEELDTNFLSLLMKNPTRLFDSYFTNIEGDTYKFTIYESILSDKDLLELSKLQPKEGKCGVLLNREEFKNIPFFDDLLETREKYLKSIE